MAGSVSVVIPVKDDPRVFEAVRSVLACSAEAKSLEVIVIDNASEAEFSTALEAGLPAEVRLMVEPVAGVYRARNRAVEAAAGEVVFFTDADCVVQPGWLAAGQAAIATGGDLVQGFSGGAGSTPVQQLLQGRYESHLMRLAAGDGTECDTRNLAVRRQVFERLKFEDRYRRVGDTEFGLVAESLGFRVWYEPGMRVAHDHDEDLRLFAAKQACHGWGAQRLMRTHRDIRWHGGHLKTVAKVSDLLAKLPGTTLLGRACIRAAVLSAGALQWQANRVPGWLGFAWLTAIDKLAALGGHLTYRPGAEEPSPSKILGVRQARD